MTERIYNKILLIWSGLLSLISIIGAISCVCRSERLVQTQTWSDFQKMPLIGSLFKSEFLVGILLFLLVAVPSIIHIALTIFESRNARFAAGFRDVIWFLFFALLTGVRGCRVIAAVAIAAGCLLMICNYVYDSKLKKEEHYINHWSNVDLEHRTFHRL